MIARAFPQDQQAILIFGRPYGAGAPGPALTYYSGLMSGRTNTKTSTNSLRMVSHEPSLSPKRI
jgi:hypothetical protein